MGVRGGPRADGGAGVNHYVRLSRAKSELQLTGTTQDAALLRTIESVSRAIDQELKPRAFYSQVATRYFDTEGEDELWTSPAGDLLSVTTLKLDEDGDGVYELTLTENTDFYLWPYNVEQKDRIDLRVSQGARSAFPPGRRRVEVVGKWGYSEDTDAAGTLGAAISSASATTATLTAGHDVEAGDTIIIDSEQIYVGAVSSNTASELVRGINGTTAATHLISAAVSVRRYPADIEHATIMQLTRYRWDLQTGYGGASAMTDGGPVSLWPQVRGILRGYARMSPGLVF